MVIRRKDPKYRRKGARAAEDRPTWTAERRRTLASGGDVVQDGIEFGATPSPWTLVRRPGRCFTWRTTGQNLGVAQSYPISVGMSTVAHGPLAKNFSIVCR